MTDRDRRRLGASDARLITRVGAVLDAMAAQGHPMLVTDGPRTQAEQILLWKQGRETPGPVVTHADGIGTLSLHQRGRAADCAFLDVDGQPSWSETHPWRLYGETAEQHGLVWGGRWPAPTTDRPHVQLPPDDPSVRVT